MYSSDRTESPGSNMCVSKSICKVTVRLVVPTARRLALVDVDGAFFDAAIAVVVSAEPSISSQPLTICMKNSKKKNIHHYKKKHCSLVTGNRQTRPQSQNVAHGTTPFRNANTVERQPHTSTYQNRRYTL